MKSAGNSPAEAAGQKEDESLAGAPSLWQKWRTYVIWGTIITCIAAVVIIIVCVMVAKSHATGEAIPATATVAARLLLNKPKGDPRTYQYAALPNGVEVVNIRDATAVTSAYSVAVLAGSFDDPSEFPGLAHFCEHMVFLGTKSYPEPSGYDDFVAGNGGYLNAYTADEATVYFTELSHDAFRDGLARFSEFFSSPLFNKQYVQKEVQAIDSEHAKNVQDPTWRVFDLMQSLASPQSPVSGFHTGDVQTLYKVPEERGLDPVDGLRAWYQDHYCPNKMRLVTFGPDPLEDQLIIATTFFSNISMGSETCQAPRRSWATPPAWPAPTLGKWLNVLGTQPQTDMMIFFPMPDLSAAFLSQPMQYLDYVFTYGGPQSLMMTMRDTLGLVSSISLSADDSSPGTSFFISCRLAQKGREHPELVLDMIYQYIVTLRSAGVDRQLYGSLANVSRLSWDWSELQSSADAASTMAERMTRLPVDDLLSGDYLIVQQDPELVMSLLERLTPPNMNVAFIDPDAESKFFQNNKVQHLPHYGIAYTEAELSAKAPQSFERWSRWTSTCNLTLASEELMAQLPQLGALPSSSPLPLPPKPIAGVPASLPLDHMEADRGPPGDSAQLATQVLFGSQPAPQTPATERLASQSIWYREGWMTTSPKAHLQMSFKPQRPKDEIEISAVEGLRLGFYTSLLAEELVPKLVDLTAAGASIDVGLSTMGVSVSVGGFPPLLPRLVEQFLVEFQKGVNLTDLSRYNRLYREYNESFREHSGMPVDYALQDRNILLTARQHSEEESLEALSATKPETVGNAAEELLFSKPLHLTALAMGNVGPDAAEQAIVAISDKVVRQASKQADAEDLTPIVKPAQPIELRKLNPRAGDGNDAVVVTLMSGVSTVESRVVLGLLGQLLQPLAYTELRTQQQLGYVVNAGLGAMSNVQYISTIVQGEKKRSDEMEAAVEQVYLDLMPKRLHNLTHDEFLNFKESFRQSLLQPPVSFSDEFDHFWPWILKGGKCFTLQDEMLKYLDLLETKAPLIEAWDRLITPASGVRQKVTVKYFANTIPERPTKAKAEGLWADKGVPKSRMDLLRKEYDGTLIVSKADSSTRARLAKEGGYFPRELNCKLAVQTSAVASASPSLAAPSASLLALTAHHSDASQHHDQARSAEKLGPRHRGTAGGASRRATSKAFLEPR